jgi:hypothetical protein
VDVRIAESRQYALVFQIHGFARRKLVGQLISRKKNPAILFHQVLEDAILIFAGYKLGIFKYAHDKPPVS